MADIIAYIVGIYGRLDTRVETRCPGESASPVWLTALVICPTLESNKSFYFKVLLKFFSYHAKIPYRFLSNYYLIMMSVSLWIWAGHYGNYRLHFTLSNRKIQKVFLRMEWEINNYKKINDKKFCSKENLIDIQKKDKRWKVSFRTTNWMLHGDSNFMGTVLFLNIRVPICCSP